MLQTSFYLIVLVSPLLLVGIFAATAATSRLQS